MKLFLCAMASAVLIVALIGPRIAPHDPWAQSLELRLMPPSWSGGPERSHLLGTDQLGRDVLSRILAGAQVSILLPVSSALAACVVGTTLGLYAALRNGVMDRAILGALEVQVSIPSVLLAVVIATLVGPSTLNLAIVLLVTSWPKFARVARAEAMRVMRLDFITAARALGCSDARIVSRHLAPNIAPPIVALFVSEMGRLTLAGASLTFLGIGLSPETPSWGQMLAESRDYIGTCWWIGVFPGLAVVFSVLVLATLAEVSASVLDPVRWVQADRTIALHGADKEA